MTNSDKRPITTLSESTLIRATPFFNLRVTLFTVTMAVVLPILSLNAHSANTNKDPITLSPYQATYSGTLMGFEITLTRSLTKEAERFTLRNKGNAIIGTLQEVSHFRIENRQIKSEDFTYELKSLVNQRLQVQFLPEEGKIRSFKKGKWSEYPWQPKLLDRLSQQEQLRLELMAEPSSPEKVSFTVVDGHRLRDMTMMLVGSETIDSNLGHLKTLHYRRIHNNPNKRSTDIWIAPSLDHIIVKIIHIENGIKNTTQLKSYDPI